MKSKITLLIVTGNVIGAIVTYLYFSTVRQAHEARLDVPPFYDDLFFSIVTAILVITFVSVIRRHSSKYYIKTM